MSDTGKSVQSYSQLAPNLPEDRLFTVELNGNQALGLYREGFIHPALLQDLNEYSRHLNRARLFVIGDDNQLHFTRGTHYYYPENTPQAKPCEIHIDVTEALNPLQTCYPRVTENGFIWVVSKALVKPELVREWNDYTKTLQADYLDYRK